MITGRSIRKNMPLPAGGRRRERRSRLLNTTVAVSVAVAIAVIFGGAGLTAASAATPTVSVASNATFGTILTTGSGMALYTLNTDHDGQSTCHGSCAAVWPPLNIPAGTVPTAGPGVTGTVGSSKQPNGTFQVTYNGSPVYTFVSDSAPGQVTGNNVTGFFVVTAAPATPSTTAPPGNPTTGTTPAPPAGTTVSPTPVVAPTSAPTAPTAPSNGSGSGVTSTAPGALAFTGAGPGLTLLLLLGLLLVFLGAGVILTAGSSSRTPTSKR
jgi:predicted lipoprotein with Yx(FWY)xxD motif